MAIDRSRRRPRLAMVVARQSVGEALLEDRRRVQMEMGSGDERQVVVMASSDEIRWARTTSATAAAAAPRATATQTQRRLVAYAHRARHFLSHRSVADSLSHSRRSEMLREIQRLKNEMETLQEQIQVTTRSVESMERLAFHLERLTRDFVPWDTGRGLQDLEEVQVLTAATDAPLEPPGAPQREEERRDE